MYSDTTFKENTNDNDNITTSSSADEAESFDTLIYPKLYQRLFQTVSLSGSGSGKLFDTDGLIKCLSAEITTYEQYERFSVARYMFWKYFSSLKTNFYCKYKCNQY